MQFFNRFSNHFQLILFSISIWDWYINVSTYQHETSIRKLFINNFFEKMDFNEDREHSGLGLNIVKNLVELHDGEIVASNRIDKEGAMIEIRFPNV